MGEFLLDEYCYSTPDSGGEYHGEDGQVQHGPPFSSAAIFTIPEAALHALVPEPICTNHFENHDVANYGTDNHPRFKGIVPENGLHIHFQISIGHNRARGPRIKGFAQPSFIIENFDFLVFLVNLHIA